LCFKRAFFKNRRPLAILPGFIIKINIGYTNSINFWYTLIIKTIPDERLI
jgi:hypothetical protein